MNNNNNNNSNNNTNTTSGYRPIVPAPSPSSTIINPMIPISPHHSPQARPSPQHGILPPPMTFRTPPVSPFSLPINMNPEYLPPPLQPLPPMMTMSMTTPPSPTNGRYEQRILPKQQTAPSTSVFSVPMTPSNASSVMQHHNSIIHPPYQQQRLGVAATGDKQLTTADQRELARKVSHSAIERRRRERINDKILQLKELIPSCADQDHLHKLSILQSAIEYIQYLQGCVAESRKREGNNNGNSEERFTKRSKFDRYEIPIPKHLKDDNSEYKRKNSSEKSSDSDGESSVTSTKAKKATSDASTNTETDTKNGGELNNEEANTLLLLSKSTSTGTNDTNNNTNTNNNNKEIPKTRNVEVQISPETIEIEEEQKEEPRRGITVQQLLCN